MPAEKPGRLDGYIRVSRVGSREGDSFISPDVQREQITAWAKLRGVTIAAWHEDLDQSGGKLERPGLDAMLARIHAGETEGVVVAKLDRLSRLGVGDALKLVEDIHDAGGSIAAIDLGVDPTTEFGEFAMTIMLALARMERRRMSAGWEVAKERATDRGSKIGPTPFGYRRKKGQPLEPHPKQADIVRTAYELAGSVGGVQRAVAYLKAKAPERTWNTAVVRRLLAKRTYLGEIHYGGQVNLDAHEPLVDARTWELAQSTGNTRSPSDSFPITGLPECGTCGSPMVGSRAGNDPTTGRGYRMYRCNADTCPAQAATTAERLEVYLRDRVVAMLEAAKQNGGGDPLAPYRRLKTAETNRKRAEDELVTFASDAAVKAMIGEDAWRAGLESRVTARDRAREEHEQAMTQAKLQKPPTLAKLRRAEGEELGRGLRGACARVIVQKGRGQLEDRVTIHLHEAESRDPERPGPA